MRPLQMGEDKNNPTAGTAVSRIKAGIGQVFDPWYDDVIRGVWHAANAPLAREGLDVLALPGGA